MTQETATARLASHYALIERLRNAPEKWSLNPILEDDIRDAAERLTALTRPLGASDDPRPPSDDDLILRRDAFAAAQVARDQVDDVEAFYHALHRGIADIPASSPSGDTEAVTRDELIRDAWGALNFILAFYEPGQRYLDTNAWKNCEASARLVHRRLADALPAPPKASGGDHADR
jgi:hypothetical protein